MIRVCANEYFPITVALVDENTGQAASGYIVNYDVRKQPLDSSLEPPISGILTESIVEAGIYKTLQSISEEGSYIIYATCSGFLSGTDEVMVVPREDFAELESLVKQTRHYNISVEDVVRTSDTPTQSQLIRKVPIGKTDYVITRIKRDTDIDWSGSNVVEGRTYAWYARTNSKVPYKVGNDGL